MKNSLVLIGVVAAALIGCSHSHNTPSAAAKAYPLNKCLVSDEAFDHDTYTFVHNGQEVKLCCKSCLKDFEKNPGKYLSKLK
jgi:YHS domain-containing protein